MMHDRQLRSASTCAPRAFMLVFHQRAPLVSRLRLTANLPLLLLYRKRLFVTQVTYTHLTSRRRMQRRRATRSRDNQSVGGANTQVSSSSRHLNAISRIRERRLVHSVTCAQIGGRRFETIAGSDPGDS